MIMSLHNRYCRCSACCDKGLTEAQTATNKEIVVPVPAKSDYELALESGLIPPDTTLEEWLNRPSSSTGNVVEYGENV